MSVPALLKPLTSRKCLGAESLQLQKTMPASSAPKSQSSQPGGLNGIWMWMNPRLLALPGSNSPRQLLDVHHLTKWVEDLC